MTFIVPAHCMKTTLSSIFFF